MGRIKYNGAFAIIICLTLTIYSNAQEKRNLDDFKRLGRDSIIGCAKHELMWRHKKIGLNIQCYSRVEVLAGIEDGKEALYINFDNPIRFREELNPDRIGINLLSGESYFTSRGDIENFYCDQQSGRMTNFLNCLSKSETGGNLIALPGPNSPTSSYAEVIEYSDHYVFIIFTSSSEAKYWLYKSDSKIKEMERKNIEHSAGQKPNLEVLK